MDGVIGGGMEDGRATPIFEDLFQVLWMNVPYALI